MAKVTGFHNSGRWDRSDELLERNVRRMRRDGRSYGTRTELTGREHADELHWPGDGWRHFHPTTEFGLANCSAEWDAGEWKKLDEDVIRLTDIRITTKGGFKLPPSELILVVLEHLRTGVEMELSVAHMNLHNTPLRNKAWHEEADTLRKHFVSSKRKHPDRIRTYQADINRTQRLRSNQQLVRQEILPRTGMHNLWVGNLPPGNQGTHGRAILDTALTSAPGKIYLLPDDISSDHRPFGTELNLAA
jgi:hypothetical protein